MLSPLVNNPIIIRGRIDRTNVDTVLIDYNILGRENFNNPDWQCITVQQTVRDGHVLDYENMQQSTGVFFNVNVYLALRRACAHALVSMYNRDGGTGTSLDLSEFVRRNKRGSKRFRCCLENSNQSMKGLNVTRKFCELIDCPIVPENIGGRLLGLWNTTFLPVNLRTFAF